MGILEDKQQLCIRKGDGEKTPSLIYSRIRSRERKEKYHEKNQNLCSI